MVDIKLHGKLGEHIGPDWRLDVKSVSEAIRAIEMNSKKLYRYLANENHGQGKYHVLVNERKVELGDDFSLDNEESIINSELMVKHKDLKSIDIVPVLEGDDSKILGVLLIVVAIIVFIASWGSAGGLSAKAVVLALGLFAAGAGALLSKPPKFDDFREIEQGGKLSYLFGGPANILGEGGPVPLGYGKLLVGSQSISAAYAILQVNKNGVVLRNVNPITPVYSYPDYIAGGA